MQPLLKWAGSKRALAPFLLDLFPAHIRTYHEPFVGSGAVFLSLPPERFDRAVIGDANPHLVNFYRAVRDFPEDMAGRLATLAQEYEGAPAEVYQSWKLRMHTDPDPLARAALFLAVNKTCFNGLHRVNRAGRFNVPWGKRPARFPELWAIEGVSEALNHHVRLVTEGFEGARRAQPGDLVYLDPPYMPLSATASFAGYAAGGFGVVEHMALAGALHHQRREPVHLGFGGARPQAQPER